MRFLAFRFHRNSHHEEYKPNVPAMWMNVPMVVLEDARCSLREEYDSFENLPYEEEWDEDRSC